MKETRQLKKDNNELFLKDWLNFPVDIFVIWYIMIDANVPLWCCSQMCCDGYVSLDSVCTEEVSPLSYNKALLP